MDHRLIKEFRYREILQCKYCETHIRGWKESVCPECGKQWSIINPPFKTIREHFVQRHFWYKPWTWLRNNEWVKVDG